MLLCHRRKLSHDLHDLHWRRRHEFLIGAHASAQPVGSRGEQLGAFPSHDCDRHFAVLRGPGGCDGRAQHDFADHSYFLPLDHGT